MKTNTTPQKTTLSFKIREDVSDEFDRITLEMGVKKQAILTSLLMQWNKINKNNTIFLHEGTKNEN